jgi:hypothetical protein
MKESGATAVKKVKNTNSKELVYFESAIKQEKL